MLLIVGQNLFILHLNDKNLIVLQKRKIEIAVCATKTKQYSNTVNKNITTSINIKNFKEKYNNKRDKKQVKQRNYKHVVFVLLHAPVPCSWHKEKEGFDLKFYDIFL